MEKIGDSTNPYDLLQIWERQIEKNSLAGIKLK